MEEEIKAKKTKASAMKEGKKKKKTELFQPEEEINIRRQNW